MRKRPSSLVFFYINLFVIILQHIPMVGLLLMFVGSQFWSIILINAGFVGIAIEASFRCVSRLWLSLPLLWFGSYGALLVAEGLVISSLKGDIINHNKSIVVDFDKNSDRIVFYGDEFPEWVVRKYDIAIAYGHTPSYITPRSYSVQRVVASACREIERDAVLKKAEIAISWPEQSYKGGSGPFCVLRLPEAPDRPAFEVSISSNRGRIFTLPVRWEEQTIISPNQKRYVMEDAEYEFLPKFPMPLIGCPFLRDAPDWLCPLEFLRIPRNKVAYQRSSNSLFTDAIVDAFQLREKPLEEQTMLAADDALELFRQAKLRSAVVGRAQ